MMAVVIPVEEENVPEACAEQSRDAAVDAEVDDVFLVAASICLGEEVADACREDDRERQHEAVRPDREVSDIEKILMHKIPSFSFSFCHDSFMMTQTIFIIAQTGWLEKGSGTVQFVFEICLSLWYNKPCQHVNASMERVDCGESGSEPGEVRAGRAYLQGKITPEQRAE